MTHFHYDRFDTPDDLQDGKWSVNFSTNPQGDTDKAKCPLDEPEATFPPARLIRVCLPPADPGPARCHQTCRSYSDWCQLSFCSLHTLISGACPGYYISRPWRAQAWKTVSTSFNTGITMAITRGGVSRELRMVTTPSVLNTAANAWMYLAAIGKTSRTLFNGIVMTALINNGPSMLTPSEPAQPLVHPRVGAKWLQLRKGKWSVRRHDGG